MLCPGCGHENSDNAKFCNECGVSLGAPLPQATETPSISYAIETSHVISPISADFVGRQREMGALVVALDDAFAGHGQLVMLIGEPGIGKTRTAQEIAAIAETQGAQVLWGRCYEGEGGLRTDRGFNSSVLTYRKRNQNTYLSDGRRRFRRR